MIASADILHGKILVVDDKQANVLLLERVLLGAGYDSVSSTMDSGSVVPLHQENRFDLIILDLQMPVVDGFQVMEGLKEIETDGYLPVLVITAQPDHKLRALSAGAKDFISKPFEMAEVLARVHNMLEVRLLHLETGRLRDRVVAEQAVSERILLDVLPHSIVKRLKDGADVIADSFSDVTVLFADIVGFTEFAAGVSSERLVSLLNGIFTDFDAIADKRGLEKIKSIGDAYMAAAGVPIAAADHAIRAADMALDMIDAVEEFNKRNGCAFQIRVGVSSGPVVAGVIGKRKFIYDLWGATVNTASRMESQGIGGCVQISETTRSLLGESFLLEARGGVDIKGMGVIRTWMLGGRRVEERVI